MPAFSILVWATGEDSFCPQDQHQSLQGRWEEEEDRCLENLLALLLAGEQTGLFQSCFTPWEDHLISPMPQRTGPGSPHRR